MFLILLFLMALAAMIICIMIASYCGGIIAVIFYSDAIACIIFMVWIIKRLVRRIKRLIG